MDKFHVKTSINSKCTKNVWQTNFSENGATKIGFSVGASLHISLGTKKPTKFTDFSDNRLLQILNSPLDQPLYESDNNLPSIYNSSSSLISSTSTSSFNHTSDENMPPPDFIAHNDEGYFHFVIETIVYCVCIYLIRYLNLIFFFLLLKISSHCIHLT